MDTRLLFHFSFWIFINAVEATQGNITVGCPDEPSCLRCGALGCIKCPQLIVAGARSCVIICPPGHSDRWSTEPDYMGRVCWPNGYIGLSGEALAAVVGVCTGATLCLSIVIVGVLAIRCRRARTSSEEDIIGSMSERREFLKDLDILRPQANAFLAILNDTRRQMRALHMSGDTNAALAYLPVVRDLAKLLLLLNRSPDGIAAAPHDWNRLSTWAEKLLGRYKRVSTVSQPQFAELINFLQSPVPSESGGVIPSPLSTFKPNGFGSSISLQEFRTNSFRDQRLSVVPHQQWQLPVAPPFTTLNYTADTDNMGSSLWLEDDFFQLGFRPQDEITTEL